MAPLPIMKENRISPVGRFFVYLIIGLACLSAVYNIGAGHVARPMAFLIVLAGFVLFLSSKLSVILKKKLISFGSKPMSETMGNFYRIGYWLMIVGLLYTFV
jgi:hypothetical protein